MCSTMFRKNARPHQSSLNLLETDPSKVLLGRASQQQRSKPKQPTNKNPNATTQKQLKIRRGYSYKWTSYQICCIVFAQYPFFGLFWQIFRKQSCRKSCLGGHHSSRGPSQNNQQNATAPKEQKPTEQANKNKRFRHIFIQVDSLLDPFFLCVFCWSCVCSLFCVRWFVSGTFRKQNCPKSCLEGHHNYDVFGYCFPPLQQHV